MINIKKLSASFRQATWGINKVFSEEQNFRIQLALSGVVLVLGLILHLRAYEFIILILMILAVLILELVNTIFERLIDIVKPRLHSYVKDIKDMMAGAVFLAAIGSVVVGLIIFLPYLINLFL